MKYAELVVDWLVELGYTHCFFVAGGNIMHLLDAVRSRVKCVPFVHEVAAGIAAEFFNEASSENRKAFALVTAGPGLTNIVTAFGGAWLESRDLLVLGGQVKSPDLARGEVRQRGIQEIDGAAIVKPIAVVSERLEKPVSKSTFVEWVERGRTGRKGPVFLEFCLDVQGAPVDRASLENQPSRNDSAIAAATSVSTAKRTAGEVAAIVRRSNRPVFLLGGGLSREAATECAAGLRGAPVALMTTWNGLDRVDARWPNYFGRPNTWGQRYANVLIQQADAIIALGTRLGIQQTGFNWQEFAPLATIVQCDVDAAELRKGHPRVDLPLQCDANEMLRQLVRQDLGSHAEWLDFCRSVRELLPLEDPQNVTAPGYIDPYRFAAQLSDVCGERDMIVPCSSGGAYTTMMQGYLQRFGQIVISDKGSAPMGYGLSGAIGSALAHPDRRVILTEGDGGFTQNLQELATVDANRLNLKIFVYSNEGYASIRMTQRNYFRGEYLGCDTKTGLGFPDFVKLFDAYSIPAMQLTDAGTATPGFEALFDTHGPAAFIVPLDPEQTYYPKISSRVTASGSMESAPLHLMSPDLDANLAARVMPYLQFEIAKKT